MHHFIAEDIAPPYGWLSPEESHHALQVLRLGPGAKISVTKGDGRIFKALIIGEEEKRARFELGEESLPQQMPLLHLGIAPPKSQDRYNFLLEKATEWGVARITPLLCKHSERRQVKKTRGEKVIIAAVKQSKKGFIPQLDELTPLRQFLGHPPEGVKWICHLRPGKHRELTDCDWSASLCALVGPEGDFSQEEVEMAREAGWQDLALGPEVLRTETAGLSLCAAAYLQRTTGKM